MRIIVATICAINLIFEDNPLISSINPTTKINVAARAIPFNSSGKYKGLNKISKRERKFLRTTLFQLAVGVVSNNDEFRKLYKHKKVTKKGRVAIISIAVKILKILFSMIKNKKEYDGSLVLQGLSS